MSGNRNSGRKINDDGKVPKASIVNGKIEFKNLSMMARRLDPSPTPSALRMALLKEPGRGMRLRDRARKAFPQFVRRVDGLLKQISRAGKGAEKTTTKRQGIAQTINRTSQCNR